MPRKLQYSAAEPMLDEAAPSAAEQRHAHAPPDRPAQHDLALSRRSAALKERATAQPPCFVVFLFARAPVLCFARQTSIAQSVLSYPLLRLPVGGRQHAQS
jgi:hypothetical protein